MTSFSWTLPSTASAPVSGSSDPIDSQLGRFFGTDIYFRNDYSITAQGDFLLIDGIANLREAIYRRLLTRPGEYKFVPEYGVGISSFVKRKASGEVLDELETAIREQLLREERIESVERIAIEPTESGLNISLIVRASGRALRFRPFSFTEEQ